MADEQRNEHVFYVVDVYFRGMQEIKQHVQWGPFSDFDMAQQCVVEMASRHDVLQAIIDESELKKPLNVEKVLRGIRGQV